MNDIIRAAIVACKQTKLVAILLTIILAIVLGKILRDPFPPLRIVHLKKAVEYMYVEALY